LSRVQRLQEFETEAGERTAVVLFVLQGYVCGSNVA